MADMTVPWLALVLICAEPVPPACISPSIDAITSNPVCIAVSKSCTLHERLVEIDAALTIKNQLRACLAHGAALLAEERRQGYRRGRTECSPIGDRP